MFQNKGIMKKVFIIICLGVFSLSAAQKNVLKSFDVTNASLKNPV